MAGSRAGGISPGAWGFLLVLGLCLGLLGAAHAQDAKGDQTALLFLRAALDPISRAKNTPTPGWWVATRWSRRTLPCASSRWLFVICDSDGRVTEVHLNNTRGVKLQGEIPWAKLGPLDRLQTLSLQNQEVGGDAFPNDTPSLGSIIFLDLGTNKLKTFTEQVSQLASLTYLSLGNNPTLSGPIPGNITTLTGLAYLNLGNTNLQGPFPDVSGSVGLTELDLGGMELSGALPDTYSTLTALTLLDISRNNATGTIPPSWSSLAQLKSLDASMNKLTGAFPQAVSNMTALTYVSLRANAFYNAVPGNIWSSTIPRIDLRQNFFSGTVPSTFNSSAILIAMNCFTGPVPAPSMDQKTNATCSAFYNNIVPLIPVAPPPTGGGSSTNVGLIIGLSVAGGVLLLVLIGLLVWFFISRRSDDDEDYDEDDEEDHDERGDEDEEEEEDDDDDDDKDRR